MEKLEKFEINLVAELLLSKNKGLGLSKMTAFKFEVVVNLLWEARHGTINLYRNIYEWALKEIHNIGSYMKMECPIVLTGSGRWAALDGGGRYKAFLDICREAIMGVLKKDDNDALLLRELLLLSLNSLSLKEGMKAIIKRSLMSREIWEEWVLHKNTIVKATILVDGGEKITREYAISKGYCADGIDQFCQENGITGDSIALYKLERYAVNYPAIYRIINDLAIDKYYRLSQIEDEVAVEQ